jgi:hypothetical protein
MGCTFFFELPLYLSPSELPSIDRVDPSPLLSLSSLHQSLQSLSLSTHSGYNRVAQAPPVRSLPYRWARWVLGRSGVDSTVVPEDRDAASNAVAAVDELKHESSRKDEREKQSLEVRKSFLHDSLSSHLASETGDERHREGREGGGRADLVLHSSCPGLRSNPVRIYAVDEDGDKDDSEGASNVRRKRHSGTAGPCTPANS